ncbi:serine hydrolase domain-containing protein [Euzebya tangerina]|uniref:serine hydrolase domain-containing protein n=1 Tax=Euzebya tangerina TaxID=591198 RepID=UPI000E312F3D|nr:serine hydrolase [Euzebya tangerina]
MSRARKVLLGSGVAVVLIVAGVLLYARPLLETATGYAAHNACAVRLLAGRGVEAPAADLPPNPLVPLMSTSVDESEGTASAALFGLFGQTAWHTPGLGCTLADERPTLTSPDPVEIVADEVWPLGETVPPPPADVDSAALEAALDSAFAEDDPAGRAVGARAVVVVHEGQIVAERYADGFDADTPQLGWSMAKSVTNAMVGRLVADGVLTLDQDNLVSAWTGDRAAITLDDLLHMASGLEWDETYALGTPVTEMLYRQTDMGAYAADLPLESDIGSVTQYSSGTTNIICDILHTETGTGEALAHELVFRPLGMHTAVLEPDASGDLVCSSYLWATPRDWARFGLWFADGGSWQGEQLLPPEWVEYSSESRAAEGEDAGHAAHWWANDTGDGDLVLPDVPADAFWASGHDGQRVFVVPSEELVVVRMGFTPQIPSSELGYNEMLSDIIDGL